MNDSFFIFSSLFWYESELTKVIRFDCKSEIIFYNSSLTGERKMLPTNEHIVNQIRGLNELKFINRMVNFVFIFSLLFCKSTVK